MKQPRSRQEPRRMGNSAMVITMLLSLCVLTFIKARYCTTPYPNKPAPLLEVEIDDDYDGSRYKISGPIGEEDFDPSRPTCYNTSKRSERCAAVGDIRVDGNHSKIYISPLDKEWRTKPYARRHDAVAMDDVREFALLPFGASNETVIPPLCTRNHSVPAFLFSSGGFAGNLYHDYTDVLVPLFTSTHHFGGEVQFLLTDIKDWWLDKFTPLFRHLSNYDVIDVDNDQEVHCFPRIVIGSTFHRAMGIDATRSPGGETVADFKRLLRRTFHLKRDVASHIKPRLLIISRKSSRRFLNERAMAHAAALAQFDVRIAEPDNHTDMPNFARLVNSADVMMGVHGAGLTNMVFLPSRAVLVQVVPFGGLEWLSRVTFKDPAKDMDVTYMEYNVSLEESSLKNLYPKDHFYLQHPYDVHKKGWDAIKTVYLDKQSVTLNLTKFADALEHARSLLP
ncbi:alpha-1,3-arabinosyltransferase XAT2 [Lolium perenne]|uniref:alpha-1,3-arabinosyltransferase XAT2 n=1 Tax=Lolium perenne TaxID=4522 RepID=UPI0021F541F4|nr:alpha-1,3-arabinosyltransferase XAT2-like [Lolium perenne]